MRDGERLSLQVDLPPAEGPAQATGQRAAYVWAELPVPVIAAVTRQRARRRPADRARRRHPHRRTGRPAVGAGDQVGPGPRHDRQQLLPELVGRDVAKELTFTGRDGERHRGRRIGLATGPIPTRAQHAWRWPGASPARSPHAIRAAKRLLDQAGRVGPGRGLRRRAEGDRRAHRQPEPGRGGRRRVRQAPARLRRPGLTPHPTTHPEPPPGCAQTFENPKTGAVLETAFVYPDGTKGTDLYLSVTSRDTVPPNPYRR